MAQSDVQDRISPWMELDGPNLGYALELYDRYAADPTSVDVVTRQMFHRWGPPPQGLFSRPLESVHQAPPVGDFRHIINAQRLARNIREYGHLAARVNPLTDEQTRVPMLDAESYGLSEAMLISIPAELVWTNPPADVKTAQDVIRRLRDMYTGALGFDFAHVHDEEERTWLEQQVESARFQNALPAGEKRALLRRLTQVESFERFLHRTFVGQKRFSIEGVDTLVPVLDEIIETAVSSGTRCVMMGMAHRGRLNVLAHVLGKPYAAIFSEFHTAPNKELVPSEGSMGINYGWTGDVKYHLGASKELQDETTAEVRLMLANNPSHLEFVNPVVEGYTRACQDNRQGPGAPMQDVTVSLAILVHGDAAFPGEGIVAETLNLSRLPGYQVGGTIHIIANNQVGFTAEAHEGRSTRYASDLAKGFDIPIIHVSADNPEACIRAARFAVAYRQRFHKDVLIDLIGYRRLGHNEMDDPVMTQPTMYALIQQHPTVRAHYAEQLQGEGVMSAADVDEIETEVVSEFQLAYQTMKDMEDGFSAPDLSAELPPIPDKTGVSIKAMTELNDALQQYPAAFKVYGKLSRVLDRRREAMASTSRQIDWAHAETLAFATILSDGTPIRLTGQDVERGTFSQRHLVLHDEATGRRHCPLQHLAQAKASFEVHNSPLSEAAVMGFEYGYNVVAPDVLVLWEAQFGDFANAGQVLIDQFLSSGRAKWGQRCGLVLLLPHGYEGQGPEHSSGRMERFLQLSAENNWRVVNPTSAAQYFHLLRTQAMMLRADPRPLIVMTPKSLLRNPSAASSVDELVNGSFQTVIRTGMAKDADAVTRLVLSTGKVSVQLMADASKRETLAWLDAARVEQLYPFPEAELRSVIDSYPNLGEVVWLQEEPQNMGAWGYVQRRLSELLPESISLRYVGRPLRSSPAEGFATAHEAIQQRLIDRVFQLNLEPRSEEM